MKPKIKIERGVPVPPFRADAHAYPVEELGIGDSFTAPSGTKPQSFRTAVASKAKKLGFKVTTRQTPEGLRCWRIE